jgi:hypothetical protein
MTKHTIEPTSASTVAVPSSGPGDPVVISAVGGAGLVLGSVQYLLETTGPLSVLDAFLHRSAPWVVAAFVVGHLLRRRPEHIAALAGLAAVLGLTTGFYVTARIDHMPGALDGLIFYTVLATVMGPVYAVAGALLEAERSPLRTAVMGAVVAACLTFGLRATLVSLGGGVPVTALLVAPTFVVAAAWVSRQVSRSRGEASAILTTGAVAVGGLVVLGLAMAVD